MGLPTIRQMDQRAASRQVRRAAGLIHGQSLQGWACHLELSCPVRFFVGFCRSIGRMTRVSGLWGAGSQLLARLQDSQDGSPAPCADLPFNIFAALSRDGYVRHTALNGDQPEF